MVRAKKILFLIPDGVGIRNYLYSGILEQLIDAGHELLIWHALSDRAFHELERIGGRKLRRFSLPRYRESAYEKFLRELAAYARIRHNIEITGNETIREFWVPSRRNLKLRLFYSGVEGIGGRVNDYETIRALERKHEERVRRSPHFRAFVDFLNREKPDLIFNTHQRSVTAIPAVEAAKSLGIPTVTAIYSWDNLPKARLATRTDRYFVWSEYMREEMKLYYPEIGEDRVVVTGTPQFDFYRDESLLWEREEFCTRYGLDPERRTVCFSGDDRLTSPYDPEYLADLAEAVETIDASRRPQILFRRCPADFSDRYDAVLERYADLIHIADPLWNRDSESDGWNLFYPSFEDVKLLVNIARHCETVYNVGSTMAHDFAMFDKPACYIAYDQPRAEGWSVETIYRFQHFRSMEGLDPVVWIRSKEEIAAKVTEALEHPDRVAPDRKRWLERIVGSEGNASERIVRELVFGF